MQAKKTSKGKEKKLLRKEVETGPSYCHSGSFFSKADRNVDGSEPCR